MHNSSEKSRSQPFEKHILYGIIALLCLAPLPFGSDRQAPFAIITAAIGALSIYWGICAAKDRVFVRISLSHIKWLALMMGLVLIWAVIQIIPLGFANEFWNVAKAYFPDSGIKGYISVNPQESWLAIFKISAYVTLFWLTLQICRSSNNAKKILKALSISGVVYALYGLLLKAAGAQKILWYDKIYYTESLTSTFVNRNNYATYAGIILVISIALFLHKLFENASNIKKRDFFKAISQRLFTTSLPSLMLVVIMLSALVLSASRAGISSAFLGVFVLILLSTFSSHIKKYRKIFVGLAVFMVILFAIIFGSGGGIAAGRFNRVISDTDARMAIYSITSNIIADYPMVGTGLGSFPDIFKAYRDPSFNNPLNTITVHAHNSYLELLMELGAPVALMLFAIFIIIWLKCAYGAYARQKNGYIPAIAASTALLVAFHSLFDFSAQIPAVAVIFIALLAMGLAQSWSRQIDISDASSDIHVSKLYHIISTKLSVGVGVVLVLAGIWQFGAYFIQNQQDNYNAVALEKIELAKAEGIMTSKGKELLVSAENDLKYRLKLSPIDSYSWSYLAYIKLLTADDRKEAVQLFITSISHAVYEPRLLLFRIKYIPLLWGVANEDEKEMFRSQIKLAWQFDNKKTMKIMSGELARGLLKEQVQSLPDSSVELEKFDELEKKFR